MFGQLFAVPPLMLALAGFSLFRTAWRRLAVVGCLAAVLVVDLGLAWGSSIPPTGPRTAPRPG